jgi:hypothetical protein
LKARPDRMGASVTDKSSLGVSPCANLTAPPAPEAVKTEPAVNSTPVACAGWVVCHFCGRRGRWIDPFAG